MRYAYATANWIYKLKGYSKKVSQLNDNPYQSQTINGLTITKGEDGSFTVNGTCTGSFNKTIAFIPLIQGHKYAIFRTGYRNVLQENNFNAFLQLYAPNITNITILNRESVVGAISTANGSGNCEFRFRGDNGLTYSNIKFYPMVFDLTADFGAGNEPTTVEQCEAYYGNNYISYGKQIFNCKMPIHAYKDGVEVAQIDCGRDLLFNDTLSTDGKVDIGSGKVDLGNFTYRMQSGSFLYYDTNIFDYTFTAKLICAKYEKGSISQIALGTSTDKKISIGQAGAYNGYLGIRDTSYDNATTFKTAMNGVILDYELATHTTSTFTPIQLKDNLTFVDDNGYEVEVLESKLEVKKWKAVTNYEPYGLKSYLPTTRLPAEYQEVKYLESTGTQWIDTGYAYKRSLGDKIKLVLQITSTQSDTAFFGNYTTNAFELGKISSTIRLNVSAQIPISEVEAINKIITATCINGVWSVNGITKEQGVSSDRDIPTILFGRLYNGVVDKKGECKILKFVVERNNAIIYEFIPCYRRSDHKPGMYDTVNNVFYTNQGTGEFILGEEI
ncbi:MAG: hypothetical protein KBS91_00425 [Firmicutes bacterium]|nr:hypothetical protein [Candidatus Caballimonas caccae]